MTPFLPRDHAELSDMAAQVISDSSKTGGQMHPVTQQGLISLLQIMNSYYSNLIEGHKTRPIDIEKAMHSDFSKNPSLQHLQLLSRVHIEVQKSVRQKLSEASPDLFRPDFIQWIHQIFYEKLPSEFRVLYDKEKNQKIDIIPGGLRHHEVIVGNHLPPESGSLPLFLARFCEVYQPDHHHGTHKIIAAAASHHRLVWIHPFSDGNGRVARIYTDAFMDISAIHGYGLWNISRGFARGRDQYMTALTWADAPRQGDLDGRGNLSEKGLILFCRFFLETCLDQTRFMSNLLQVDGLIDRIRGYIELRQHKMIPDHKPVKREAAYLLEEALLRGMFPRGEAPRITGLPERTARNVLRDLIQDGLLISDTPKGAVRIGFPIHAVGYWFPDLFPQHEMG